MAQTETHEHALTQKALDTLATWGRNPNTDGGENIVFSLSRQGAPSDAFLAMGDCTPFTPIAPRGQPSSVARSSGDSQMHACVFMPADLHPFSDLGILC